MDVAERLADDDKSTTLLRGVQRSEGEGGMTYDIKALRDLEKRLAEAKGPDRVADFWIAVELGPNPLKSDTGTEARPNWVQDSGQEFELWSAGGRYGFIGHHVVPRFTASLDAAVALVERVLHTWGVELILSMSRDGEWYWVARLVDPCEPEIEGDPPRKFYAVKDDKNPALALCLALVRALITQEEARQ